MPMLPNTPSAVPEPITDYLADTRATLDGLSVDQIHAVIEELHRAYRDGRQVLIIGNGGSAATATHLAVDLSKTVLGRPVNREAKRFRALSLSTDISTITAWGNDFTFDDVFAEQIEALGQPGDLLVVITGSGNSANIIAGVETAKRLGLRAIGFLGFDGGRVKDMVDTHILVESDHYGHVEDMHMVLAHLVTAYFAGVIRSGRSL
jgi:D-sedoheptulose 7-phosphate isomerase